MDQNNVPFSKILKEQWKKVSQTPDILRNNIDKVEQKILSPYIAQFNISLVEHKRESQYDFDHENDFEIVREFDESAFNFNIVEQEEILLFINLENEEILLPEKYQKLKQQGELEDEESFHPIFINVSPICKNHALIALYPQQCLPQVVGSEILQLLLTIFSFETSSYFRIGFNSIGAFSSVNHLHFQLFYVNDLSTKINRLPVEEFQKELLFQTNLQSKTNTSEMPVQVHQLPSYPVKTFVFTTVGDSSAESFISLGYAVGLACTMLLDLKIPFNLLISEGGKQIYLFPRQFERKQNQDYNMKPGFLEISGIGICRNLQFYDSFSVDSYENLFKNEVSLNDSQFKILQEKLEKIFSNFT